MQILVFPILQYVTLTFIRLTSFDLVKPRVTHPVRKLTVVWPPSFLSNCLLLKPLWTEILSSLVLRVTEGRGILSKQDFTLDGFFEDQTSHYENLRLSITY